MSASKCTYEEVIEYRWYLASKSKEMKAMFTSSQNSFNESRIKFINRQQMRSNSSPTLTGRGCRVICPLPFVNSLND